MYFQSLRQQRLWAKFKLQYKIKIYMTTKLIIIGGVAGGATAAARARRIDEFAEIVLFERGEYVSFANCGLPYYVGNVIKNRNNLLVTTADALKSRYNIDVRLFSEVVKIDRDKKEVHVKDLSTGKTYNESYDKIILSPGAEPVKPLLDGIDNENIFRLRSIPDTDRIKAYVDINKPDSAVIVGAGFIGLEMAENLVKRGVKTTIIEMIDQVLAPLDFEMAAIVHEYIRQKGVTCMLGRSVKSFMKSSKGIILKMDDGNEIDCGMVLLSIGVKPENKLAKDCGLTIDERGAIVVDNSMRTSDPDIFAVGDAIEVKDIVTGMPVITQLAGPANKQGRIAADNALGRKSVFKGTQGSAIVKIFDLAVAATGASEKTLAKNNIPYKVCHVHPASHATYYPGAGTVSIKLLFAPGSGRLLGAQAVGTEGVDKRIDVLAMAIRAGLTAFDLEEFEHAYAPPYSSAKDVVNIAGFVAANILKGDVETVNWNELGSPGNEYAYLDLRNKSEVAATGVFRNAVNIPLNDLRKRLGELDKSKKYIVYCATGLRSYIGCRILTQHGFSAKNLSGSYTTLTYVMDKIE
jgi:NADPH-dependent 2,4-dienoyl-CoA reductase/sulfur reductase-like enzyme/rhodanese-related sulfurtransferase